MATKNFDDIAKNSSGEPITVRNPKDGSVGAGTFKQLIVDALAARYTEDERVSPADLFKRGKLADKIDAGGDIELKADEVTMIKDYVAKAWPPRIISAIHDKVESDYTPAKKEEKATGEAHVDV